MLQLFRPPLLHLAINAPMPNNRFERSAPPESQTLGSIRSCCRMMSIAGLTIGKARFFLDCADGAGKNERVSFCNHLEAALIKISTSKTAAVHTSARSAPHFLWGTTALADVSHSVMPVFVSRR